jgi:integral membrane protein
LEFEILDLEIRVAGMKGLSLKLLRYVSLAEGVSFLVLLYAAIYQKRILGDEDAIAVPGMIHGVLFVLFCFLLLHVWLERGWPLGKVAVAFLCSLLPFAPFYLERKLKQEEASCKAEREG